MTAPTVPWLGPELADIVPSGNAIVCAVQVGILSRIHGPTPSAAFARILERHFLSVPLTTGGYLAHHECMRLLQGSIALAAELRLIERSSFDVVVPTETMLRMIPWWDDNEDSN